MNENMNLIPKIEEIVCKVFNITLEDLRGNRKFRSHMMQGVYYSIYYMLNTISPSIDYQDTMINIIV